MIQGSPHRSATVVPQDGQVEGYCERRDLLDISIQSYILFNIIKGDVGVNNIHGEGVRNKQSH